MIIRGSPIWVLHGEGLCVFSPGVMKTSVLSPRKTQTHLVYLKFRLPKNADPLQNNSELYLHDYDNTALQKRQKHDTVYH